MARKRRRRKKKQKAKMPHRSHPLLPLMSEKRFDEVMKLGEGILWQAAVDEDGKELIRPLSPTEIANNLDLDVPASILNDDLAFLKFLELSAKGTSNGNL